MTIKKFTRKILIRLVVFIVLLGVTAAVFQIIDPLASIEIAIGQMENSDESFVALSAYNWMKPIRRVVYLGAWFLFTGTVARDVYKFSKKEGETPK